MDYTHSKCEPEVSVYEGIQCFKYNPCIQYNMQPKLYPKWGTIHTKKVEEFAKEEKIVTAKASGFGEFVKWLHEKA